MKKLLFLISALFCINNVQAMEYSDYGPFSPYTEEYIQSTDLIQVKTERRYQYYKLTKELGDYSEPSLEYPYIDQKDFIYTDYIISNIEPNQQENREIEIIDGQQYKRIKNINYLVFTISMAPITLNNFEILYKGEKIDYTIEPDINFNNNTLNVGQKIIIKFNEPLEIVYLTLTFDIIEATSNISTYFIRYGCDDEEYGYLVNTYEGEDHVKWSGIYAKSYASAREYYYTENPISEYTFFYVGTVSLYKYRDKLYRNYNIVKDYYEQYLTSPYEDYIYKDKNKYKDYYAKRMRQVIKKTTEPIATSLTSKQTTKIKTITNKEPITTLQKNTPTYQLVKTNKIVPTPSSNTAYLLYTCIPFLLIIVILILVLSKLYKTKKERAKVK